ncbi:MAG: AAA family ATPase [Desulfobacteraceae bacterium]|nr:AAA family ATPase [Desulfobacteraceae bacterium]
MYLSYYNLSLKPFQITGDPRFLWLGEKQNEALSTLKSGVLEHKGFLLFTGEAGTGKTVLVNQLIKTLDIRSIVVSMPAPNIETLDFFKLLASGFGFSGSFKSKGDFLIRLREYLLKSHDSHQHVLLVVDEAQRLSYRLLEELRLLSNIELHDRKLINLFFVGRNDIVNTISLPKNRAVDQRISQRCDISPLTEKQTGDFIRHQLNVAGTVKKIFAADAVKKIHVFTRGIPRLINVICDHALLIGYARGKAKISAAIIKECTEELKIPIRDKKDIEGLQDGINEIKQEIINKITRTGAKPAAVHPTNGHTGSAPRGRDAVRSAVNPGTPIVTGPIQAKDKRSFVIPVLSVLLSFVLLGMIGYAFMRWRPSDEPQWAVDELTPQKYRTSLEQEKLSLEASLSSGENPESASTTGISSPDGGARLEASTDTATGIPATETSDPANTVSSSAAAGNSSTPARDLNTKFKTGDTIRVYFDLNSNEISSTDIIKLNEVAQFMKKSRTHRVFIKGYTDSSGSQSYNLSVSQFRANIVKSYMVGKGAPSDQIQTFALGPENPLASNDTLEGRKLNRRVEIIFINPSTDDAPTQ